MAKSNQAASVEKPMSLLALSQLLKVGRDTLRPALANVSPAGTNKGNPLWTESQARAALEAAGSRAATGPLKDQKLQEQIRQLKLLNDRKAGTLIEKAKMVSVMGAISSRNQEFWQHLLQVLPVRLVGKGIPEIIEELRKCHDDHGRMMAGCGKLFQDIK